LAAAAEFCPFSENQPKKKFGKSDDGVSAPPPKKISPVKLNAFLVTSSAQNNSAIHR